MRNEVVIRLVDSPSTESEMNQTHCPLIVPVQAMAEPQKHQACKAKLESNEKPCHRSISMK
jgi:hypothetical protein